jgi:heme/copper-type cytochrome/quinol oxidase subunit 1
MKKIENLLFWPVLVLIFCSISKYGNTTTDVHLHDTYYVIANSYITGWFLAWLLVVFFLFRVIRRRHNYINTKFAITYLLLTVVLFTISWGSGFVGGGSPAGYSDSQLDKLIFYDKVRSVTAGGLLVTQVIFLVYFVVQLLKKPVQPTGE